MIRDETNYLDRPRRRMETCYYVVTTGVRRKGPEILSSVWLRC
jgi:hypothetical protein